MSINVMLPHEALTPQKLAAATHLASGRSGVETAKLVGVTAETVSRWRKDPNFVAHLNGLKGEALATDRERLRSLRAKALDALAELLDSPSDQIRLQAVRYVLDATLINAKTAMEGIGSSDPGFAAIEALYKGAVQ
jgi:hypothetical protein